MKLGIIQGRLSPPVEGFQETPANWKKEFDLLPELGLNHIEWVVTKKSFATNPLFTQDISGYADNISAICADNIIDPNFYKGDYLETNLGKICHYAWQYKINNIVIPLLEESSVVNFTKKVLFKQHLAYYSRKYSDINFILEIESDVIIARELADLASNIYLVYDTGNLTTLKVDHEYYINMSSDKIANVHLKDRVKGKTTTVEPGEGGTNFDSIFKTLNKNNYSGLFTLQTARGKDGDEIETIKKHINYFKQYE